MAHRHQRLLNSPLLRLNPHSHCLPHFFFPLPNILKRWTKDSYDPEEQSLLPLSPSPNSSLTEKYGSCIKILHYGSYSSVRVYAPKTKTKQLHAVKVFRPSSDPVVLSSQRLEQSLSSAVSHPNLLRTLDVLRKDRGELCLVMDYCAGGDLNSLIAASEGGCIDVHDADCFFKQIMRAVVFLHDNDIAHGDLKTENILLTTHGAVKISDFGNAESLSDTAILPTSSCSSPRKFLPSIPYRPPETYTTCAVNRRASDAWAAGLVYMAMRCGRLLWKMASDENGGFSAYLRGRRTCTGYYPIEQLGETRCRNVVYASLHPDPGRRIKAADVLRSEWVFGVDVCDAGEMGW